MGVRKLAAKAMTLALLVGLVLSPVAQAAVQDVYGTRFEQAVTYLKDLGVVEGRPQGFFPLEPITRAEAVKIIIMILGNGELAGMLVGAPSFPDVGTNHWASGYIAVAKSKGIVGGYPDGTFRPESLVTYAEYAKMLVEAAGLGPVAGYAWPLNYVEPATRAGILKDTVFSADGPAIRGDCAIMTRTTVREVANPRSGRTLGQTVFGEVDIASLTLSPESQATSVGAGVDFHAVAKDGEGNALPDVKITYATSSPAHSMVTSTGRFVATHSGTYTVTATAGSYTASATVTVYGTPVALKISSSPSSVVANGVATSTLTVRVVDSNGATVPTATNTISIEHEINNGAVTLPVATTEEAKGGTAAFTVTASTFSGATDTIRAFASGLRDDTTTVKTIEPKASSFKLTAEPTQLPANSPMNAFVTAEVRDQTGQPMTFGTYYITFSISGKGYLEGGTDSITVATVDQKATVMVTSWQGEPGTIRLTASSSGLGSSQSVSIPTYIAGVPRSIRVTSVDTSGEAGTVNDMKITVGLFDSNGRPAIADDPVEVEFAAPDNSGLVGLHNVVFGAGESYRSVEFYGTKVGSYTVKVQDTAATSPLSSTTFSCRVTSGTVEQVSLSPGGGILTLVPVSRPQVTLTAQLEDSFGNPVAKSGVRLQFSATVVGTGSAPTWSASQGKVVTDSTGRATITMYGQGYVGNIYTVTLRADTNNNGVYDDLETVMGPHGIEVVDRVPYSASLTFRNLQGQLITNLQADDSRTAIATLQVLDQNGNSITNRAFDIELALSNRGRNVLDSSINLTKGLNLEASDDTEGVYSFKTDADGQAVFEFQAGLAGSYTFTVKCPNVIPAVSKSFNFASTAGTAVADAMVLKTDNTPALEINYRSSSSVTLRLALVDNGGNPVAAPGATIVTVSPSAGGQYRLTSSGMGETEIPFARGSAYRTVYYRNTVNGTADLAYDATDYLLYRPIVLTANATTVTATALADDGNPVVGAAITLVIAGGGTFASNGLSQITGNTNSQGKFTANYSGSGTVAASLNDARNKIGGTTVSIEQFEIITLP